MSGKIFLGVLTTILVTTAPLAEAQQARKMLSRADRVIK
jgi:hypothetical protein